MKKATRNLLKLRTAAKLVAVEKIDVEDAIANQCYQNACKYADSNEKELLVMSGWLVGDFLNERGTALIPHYWVVNEVTKKHYDPTPKNINDSQSYEYVMDFDILEFGYGKGMLPYPLRMLADGTVQVKHNDGRYQILSKIDVQEIYKMKD